MKPRILGRVLAAFALGASGAMVDAKALQASRAADVKPELSRWLASYVHAFNTGDVQRLSETLARLYSKPLLAEFGGSGNAAAFRLETFRTAGPLAFAPVPLYGDPAIIWTRGTISGAWIGHQAELNGSGAAVRHSLWRTRPPGAPSMKPIPPRELPNAVRQYLKRMEAAGLFSGTVELHKDGQVVLSEALGSRDLRGSEPIQAETPIDVASVTKLLTSIAILKTVESGILSLDDPVSKFVPEYPESVASRATLRHLLTHRAGIAFDDDPQYIQESRRASSAEELLRAQLNSAARVGFPNPFGEYKYSSEHIDLAAVMAERATRRQWTDLVRVHVLIPAGTANTTFAPSGNRAIGYSFSDDELQDAAPALRRVDRLLPARAKPSSHAWSTARDLAKIMRALVDGRLLGPQMTKALLEPQAPAEELPAFQLASWVGLGSQGADDFAVRTVGHGGVYPGYSALIEYFPRTGYLLTVTSNTGEHTAYIVYQRVLEMIHGVPTQVGRLNGAEAGPM